MLLKLLSLFLCLTLAEYCLRNPETGISESFQPLAGFTAVQSLLILHFREGLDITLLDLDRATNQEILELHPELIYDFSDEQVYEMLDRGDLVCEFMRNEPIVQSRVLRAAPFFNLNDCFEESDHFGDN